jgi:spermidine synthase
MGMFGNWRIRKPSEDEETVYISEKFGVRALHIGSETVQSAMRLSAPNDLELSYTRSMMGFLLFNAKPKSILMIGLGGGSIAKFIHHRMAWTRIRVLELRESVLNVARRYFSLPEQGDRFEVILGDGAEFMSRPSVCADLIIIDGFDSQAVVESLSSVVFYQHCHDRLNKGGIMAVNLWGGEKTFHDLLKRIGHAFPAGVICLPAEKPGNVAVFGFRGPVGPIRWEELERRATELEARYGLAFTRFVELLRRTNDQDQQFLRF